jgi:hypothetical protein
MVADPHTDMNRPYFIVIPFILRGLFSDTLAEAKICEKSTAPVNNILLFLIQFFCLHKHSDWNYPIFPFKLLNIMRFDEKTCWSFRAILLFVSNKCSE